MRHVGNLVRGALGPLLLVSSVLLGACGSSGSGSSSGSCTLSSAQATSAVTMQNIAYNPKCIKVTPGTTVTFTNQDSVDHTVTTEAGQAESFDSGTLAPGSSYQHTFNTAGTINLYCKIHGQAAMSMTVVVDTSAMAYRATGVGHGMGG